VRVQLLASPVYKECGGPIFEIRYELTKNLEGSLGLYDFQHWRGISLMNLLDRADTDRALFY